MKSVTKPHPPRPNLAGAEPTPAASKSGRGATRLEETLKFTNLTQFRNSLLGVIPKLQDNEFLRFVITKLGKPAAVIMSYEAYGLLKEAADSIIEQEAAKSPGIALRDAYERMTQTKLEPPLRADEIAARLASLAIEVKNLQTVVGSAARDLSLEKDASEEQKLARK